MTALRRWYPLALGIVLSVVIVLSRGVYSADIRGLMQILSDGFFVSGVLILGVGGLRYLIGKGALDMLGYSFILLLSTLRLVQNRYSSYIDYSKREHSPPKASFILSGIIISSLSLIFLTVYLLV